MLFSIIIPVYNRPEEVEELLLSLTNQTDKEFEIIIVEDGSILRCENICAKYSEKLDINYFYKENTGPGDSRNFGAKQAQGEYLLILDSDCIIPENYIRNIRSELATNPCDAFGGADEAHESFSDMQKAVNYAMTSIYTTGGIRGGKKDALEKFHPRSFNMGIRAKVYKDLGGFSDLRYGEDIDFSIRIFKAGYSVRLFPNAFVYHKRRTNIKKFFQQVFHSGEARIVLWRGTPIHSSLFTFYLRFLSWELFYFCL
jgi:glycosyltransferase involved in cell wall biosynthesis